MSSVCSFPLCNDSKKDALTMAYHCWAEERDFSDLDSAISRVTDKVMTKYVKDTWFGYLFGDNRFVRWVIKDDITRALSAFKFNLVVARDPKAEKVLADNEKWCIDKKCNEIFRLVLIKHGGVSLRQRSFRFMNKERYYRKKSTFMTGSLITALYRRKSSIHLNASLNVLKLAVGKQLIEGGAGCLSKDWNKYLVDGINRYIRGLNDPIKDFNIMDSNAVMSIALYVIDSFAESRIQEGQKELYQAACAVRNRVLAPFRWIAGCFLRSGGGE